MTPSVISHLALLTAASEGIQRLREVVWELAVCGLLTGDNADSWRRLPLGELGQWGSGGTPLKTHPEYYGGDIPWLVIGDLNDGLVTSAQQRITALGLENSSAKLVPAGTILIAMYGSIGKLGITGLECATNQAIAHCQPDPSLVSVRYLFLLLRSMRSDFLGRGQGLAQQNISQKILKSVNVELPPLELQSRIVAKVDELMALCDRLEARQQDAEAAHAQLVQSLLDSLIQTRDADEFHACWARIAGHFSTLFTTTASINRLWSAVLCLAAEGKLVKAGEQVDHLPIGELLLGDTLNGCSYKPSDAPVGVPILRISAGTGSNDFIVDETDHKWVEVTAAEREKFRLLPNDLLACRFNGNLHYVGAFALYKGASGAQQIFPDKLIRFRVDDKRVLPGYLRFVMNALPARQQIESFCATTVGNIGISATNLKTVKVRVPSLHEQRRIIAKVTELLALCDQLKARIAAARAKHAQLAEALVAQALAA